MLTPKQIHKEAMSFIHSGRKDIVVCFDFFDTLVLRSIMPEYTKRIASQHLSDLLDNYCSPAELYGMRRELEVEMCRENHATGFDPEFNLEQLAGRMFNRLNKQQIVSMNRFAKDSFVGILLYIEVAVEKQVQRPCHEMVTLLKKIRNQQVTIVLVSDFYLSERYFSKFLEHHRLASFFDHLYISADHLVTKGSGRMYDRIAKNLEIDKSSMLMIGDNSHADRKMAEESGVKSLLLDRRDQKQFYRVWEEKQRDKEACQNRLENKFDEAISRHGDKLFKEIGLSLWCFIRKLFKQLMKDGVENLFFLSREGEFLKKIFEQYQNDLYGGQIVNCHYMIASRKSTYLASLGPLSDENFARLFYQYRDISLRGFLLSLNIPETIARAICIKIGVDFDIRYQNFPESEHFREIVDCRLFKETYKNCQRVHRDGFLKYLDTFGVNFMEAGLYLVDVGWKGSIQDNIFDLLNKKVKVTGYYLGLLNSSYSHLNNVKVGLHFSEIPHPSPFFSVYNNNRSLFELILGASHGSADGYFSSEEEIKGRGSRIIAKMKTPHSGGGKVFVATEEVPEEKRLFVEKISPLQEKILGQIKAFNKTLLSTVAELPDERWFAKRHGRMVFFPKKREVDFFQDLYHLENFGVFEFTKFKSEKKLSIQKKLYNLIAVIKDPALLEIGFWPPIILRYLGIGFYRFFDGPMRYKKAFGLRDLKWI